MAINIVRAWGTETGIEQLVPEHFFDDPYLCRGLTRENPHLLEETPVEDLPTAEWTVEQMRDWATAPEHPVDLTGLTLKDDIFDAINEHITDTEKAPSGGEKE